MNLDKIEVDDWNPQLNVLYGLLQLATWLLTGAVSESHVEISVRWQLPNQCLVSNQKLQNFFVSESWVTGKCEDKVNVMLTIPLLLEQ